MKKKRSTSITLSLVAQVASLALLMGCGEEQRVSAEQVQRCIDNRTSLVIADKHCEEEWTGSSNQAKDPSTQTTPRGGGAVVHHYHPYYNWYYGGRGYDIGSRAEGGSPTPPGFNTWRPNAPGNAGVSRTISAPRGGGFGSTGVAVSGGHGGGTVGGG